MTEEEIDKLEAGVELDALVAEAMGCKPVWSTLPENRHHGAACWCGGYGVTNHDMHKQGYPHDSHADIHGGRHIARYSTDTVAVWDVFNKFALWVGGFEYCDGFATIVFSESANHSDDRHECRVNNGQVEDSMGDYTRHWSCHFHIGMLGITENGETPEHWKMGDKFCAMGETAPLAICRAVLKAVSV